MKGICLSIGLLTASLSYGQQKETVEQNDFLKYHYDSTVKSNWNPGLLKKINPATTTIINKDLRGQLSFTLANGDSVYQLPADRMPCVKPGNLYVYTMPVLTTKKEDANSGNAAPIPNPAN